jgi:hypothetical protein
MFVSPVLVQMDVCWALSLISHADQVIASQSGSNLGMIQRKVPHANKPTTFACVTHCSMLGVLLSHIEERRFVGHRCDMFGRIVPVMDNTASAQAVS